jgi:RelE toxin of RelE / RelB toxin-antitoxin system
MQSDLVQNPGRGAVVKGTRGVRKARVADPASGRGKSGSYRYLYLYLEHAGRIHLLYLFSKGDQSDLSPQQKLIIGALSQEIRKER